MAEKINDVAYEAENTRDKLQSEEIVSELVHGFLVPEVQKETVRQQTSLQSRRFLVAAHGQVYREGEEIIDDLGEVQSENQDRINSPGQTSLTLSQEDFGYGVMDTRVSNLSSRPNTEGSPSSMRANDDDDGLLPNKQKDNEKVQKSDSENKKPSSEPSSRPISANKADSRPPSTAKQGSRPVSAQNDTSSPSPPNNEESLPTLADKGDSRPASATKEASKPPTPKPDDRPISATKEEKTLPDPESESGGRVFGAATPPEQKMTQERAPSRGSSGAKTPPKPTSRPSSALSGKEDTIKDDVQKDNEKAPDN